MPSSNVHLAGKHMKQNYECSCGFTTHYYDSNKTREFVIRLHNKKCVNKNVESVHQQNLYQQNSLKKKVDFIGKITI